VISLVGWGLTVPEVDAPADSTPVSCWQPVQRHACACVLTDCAPAAAQTSIVASAAAAANFERGCMTILRATAREGAGRAQAAPRRIRIG